MPLRAGRPLQVAVVNPVRVTGSGGLVKHLQEVIPRWLATGRVGRVVVFLPRGTMTGLTGLGAEVKEVDRDDYRTGFRMMGEAVALGGYDVALCTTPRAVRTGTVPLATMVQNIEPIQEPTYAMPILWRARLWALRREISQACEQATRLVAVSEYVKTMVCRRFAVDPGIVDVVYHGFGETESHGSSRPAAGVPDRFVFSAGSIVPYRGFEDVVRALGRLSAITGEVPWTVFAGSSHHHARSYERRLRRLAESLGVADRIVWAGQLSRQEMRWCYENARAFVQTSRAEACPNIVLEAMGHGCPIISCDQPPMPEILGDVALYYRAGDSERLAALLGDVLCAPADQTSAMRARALGRAALFSWEETAMRTLETLARCAGRSAQQTGGGATARHAEPLPVAPLGMERGSRGDGRGSRRSEEVGGTPSKMRPERRSR